MITLRSNCKLPELTFLPEPQNIKYGAPDSGCGKHCVPLYFRLRISRYIKRYSKTNSTYFFFFIQPKLSNIHLSIHIGRARV